MEQWYVEIAKARAPRPALMTLLETYTTLKGYGSHQAGRTLNDVISFVIPTTPCESGISTRSSLIQTTKTPQRFHEFQNYNYFPKSLSNLNSFKFCSFLSPRKKGRQSKALSCHSDQQLYLQFVKISHDQPPQGQVKLQNLKLSVFYSSSRNPITLFTLGYKQTLICVKRRIRNQAHKKGKNLLTSKLQRRQTSREWIEQIKNIKNVLTFFIAKVNEFTVSLFMKKKLQFSHT